MDADNSSGKFAKALSILWVAATLVYVAVIGAYVLRFRSTPISDDPERWGQFGDYVGGVINPAIAVLTFLTILVTVLQNAKLARFAEQQTKAARDAQEFERSGRQLDAALEGMRRAIKLVRDGGNDRRRWIQGARILAASQRIASNITDTTHKDMLEVALFDLRNEAAALLGYENEPERPAAFFYGAPLDERGRPTVVDVEEAARLSQRPGVGVPGRLGGIHNIDPSSLWAFWNLAQFPADFDDPIGEDNFTQILNDEPIKLASYPGIQRYLEHRQQFRVVGDRLFPR
jgi:low affinity Fe/Cu permease